MFGDTMIDVGVGWSDDEDSFKAGKDAAERALEEMGKKEPLLTLVFSSVKFDLVKMLEGIRSVIKTPLIGCSDAGEITNQGPRTGSVAVMGIHSEKIKVTTGIGRKINEDARKAGQESVISGIKPMESEFKATTQLFLRSKTGFLTLTPYSLIILPDGLTGNGADVVRGVTDVVGPYFPVVGGSAGDDLKLEKTYQFYNNEVCTDSVVSALLYSDFVSGFGVRHGWHPVGKSMVVTKSEKNIIYEIDGKPAIRAYESYFEEKIEERALGRKFAVNSLGIPAWEGEYRLRWPLIKREDGSIVCAAEIPQDSVVRIMAGTEESAIEAAKIAANEAMTKAGVESAEDVAACIIFDCISRKQLLGKDAYKEIDAIKGIVGKNTPMIGFYTYGEQAPTYGAPTGFHNQTVVIYIIAKKTLEEMVVRGI